MTQKGQAHILIIALVIGLLALGGYFIYQNKNKPVSVSQPQKEITSNIKIGKYETLYKGGWEELNYIDTANSENPEELYEIFSKLYPDLTDKNSEFFIQEIIIKDDTAEVYFGGDEGAITDRMGTTGPYNYSGLVTFALTEDEKIRKVDFKLKTEGNHFGPRISIRNDFIYLWPTQLLEEVANSSKDARVALASRKRLSDETNYKQTILPEEYCNNDEDCTYAKCACRAENKQYSFGLVCTIACPPATPRCISNKCTLVSTR